MFASCRFFTAAGTVEQVNVGRCAGVTDQMKDEPSDADTPTTTVSEGDFTTEEGESESDVGIPGDEDERLTQRTLGPGLFGTEVAAVPYRSVADGARRGPLERLCATLLPTGVTASRPRGRFVPEETLFVFDWDDTLMPSTWLVRNGLRLDTVTRPTPQQRQLLGKVAASAAELINLAKNRGTVVLLTNAEKGWVELSCTKFLPALLPVIEGVKIVSARTTYETRQCCAPLDWKVKAFEAEIARACGPATLADASRRKNILSLGDSQHEREALLRATTGLPNCRSKALKFAEKPHIDVILQQHAITVAHLEEVVQHDGNLDVTVDKLSLFLSRPDLSL